MARRKVSQDGKDHTVEVQSIARWKDHHKTKTIARWKGIARWKYHHKGKKQGGNIARRRVSPQGGKNHMVESIARWKVSRGGNNLKVASIARRKELQCGSTARQKVW